MTDVARGSFHEGDSEGMGMIRSIKNTPASDEIPPMMHKKATVS